MTLTETVRLLIPDLVVPYVFTDDQIDQFIYLESSQSLYVSGQAAPLAASRTVIPQIYSVRRAAALALDVIASKLSQQASVVELLDVKLNTSAAAKSASERADSLRKQESELGNFAIAEWVTTDFAARERVWSQLLRVEGT